MTAEQIIIENSSTHIDANESLRTQEKGQRYATAPMPVLVINNPHSIQLVTSPYDSGHSRSPLAP